MEQLIATPLLKQGAVHAAQDGLDAPLSWAQARALVTIWAYRDREACEILRNAGYAQLAAELRSAEDALGVACMALDMARAQDCPDITEYERLREQEIAAAGASIKVWNKVLELVERAKLILRGPSLVTAQRAEQPGL
jgi:hypothetical protein